MAGTSLLAPLQRWLARRARARARQTAPSAQGETATRPGWLPWARRLAWPTVIAGLAIAALVAMNHPVEHVRVEGTFQRVRATDVERVVRQGLQGGFVTANLGSLRAGIEELPWVDRARLRRQWPAGLIVEVTEQVAAARWGEDGLLNARGELFVVGVKHPPPELPVLSGPPGTEWQVAQRFFAVQARLGERGLRIAAMQVDARGAWSLELSEGVEVRFGRRQVDERIQRFLDVAAGVVQPRTGDIRYVDMRYSNGFSVGWRDQADANLGDGQADG
jgi:cell division protein FtsQ